jgi:hypothetical protein
MPDLALIVTKRITVYRLFIGVCIGTSGDLVLEDKKPEISPNYKAF